MFTPFGAVLSCDLVLDQQTGQSKGFGFVELDSPEDVQTAIDALNNTLVDGVKIRVKWSNQDRHLEATQASSNTNPADIWANTKRNFESDN